MKCVHNGDNWWTVVGGVSKFGKFDSYKRVHKLSMKLRNNLEIYFMTISLVYIVNTIIH